MHSLKNTVVAILLLGVSYGVYQVITTPEPLTTADQDLIDPLNIDDGLSVTAPIDASTNPDIQLPAAANAPNSSSSLAASSKMTPANTAPPKFDQSTTAQTSDNSPDDPTTESLVSRQAKLDFDGEPDMSGNLASAELEDGGKNFARDQQLIDALKDQLESNDENDSLQSDFDPAMNGEMVSAKAAPAPPTNVAPTNVAPANGPTSVDPMNAVWSDVESKTAAGQFRTALETLTPHFGDQELSDMQRKKLMSWLDALAGKVIYSAEHNLSESYVVQANESLDDIAKRWNVTSQLVYNINKSNVANPTELAEGTELKTVQGPFHAEIDLTKKVMTLFVDNLYAGRFEVLVDENTTVDAGQYGVKQKSANGPTENGQPAAYRIALDNGVRIQASSDTNSNPSCIGLNPKDAADLFIIFTEQSQFFIKR